jgi:hypothetical protein
MSERLANLLNLELAWQRLRFDRPDRIFVTNPYSIELVELDLASFLRGIREQVSCGYIPSPSVTCPVPKGKWQVRPGVYLRLTDELIFNALVGSVFQNVIRRLQWSQGDPDIAYQLENLSTAVRWVKRGFVVWKEWREKSLQKLQTAEFVLIADIAAFYENVDLNRLTSDLRSVNMDDEAGTLLSSCMNRWAEPRGKGIPQGHSASDILAKLYLDSIDHNGLEKHWLVLPFKSFQSFTIPVLGVIWRHLVHIFNFLGNRWATQKEVEQQLGLAVI